MKARRPIVMAQWQKEGVRIKPTSMINASGILLREEEV